MTTAVAGATTGIKALAAAAAAIAGIRFLTGGGFPGIGRKGGSGGGSFSPADLLTGGGASGAGVVPVYVTNWKDIGGDDKSGVMDSLKDIPGAVGKFAAYFTAATAIKETLDEKWMTSIKNHKKKEFLLENCFSKSSMRKRYLFLTGILVPGGHPLRIFACLNRPMVIPSLVCSGACSTFTH